MFVMEAFGKESAPAAEQPDATVLDASTLKPEESLAGRDLHGWTLVGDFGGRNFDNANMRRVVARCVNFKDSSMRYVDASRADLRGSCLVGVDATGAKLRRVLCQKARMAGMFGGPGCEKPEVKAIKDGTMPPMEPLAATDGAAMKWAEEQAKLVDATKEAEEDAQWDEVWKSHIQRLSGFGFKEEEQKACLDMQQMDALYHLHAWKHIH